MLQVPSSLAKRAYQDLGVQGRAWIERLPQAVAAGQRRWSLTPDALLPQGKELSLLIAVTMSDGQPAVLKVAYPDAALHREAAALSQWSGNGSVALLNSDPDQGLLLLEYLAPRQSLRTEGDATALPLASAVLRQLWTPPPRLHPFPRTVDQAQRWAPRMSEQYRQLGRPFAADLLHAATAAAEELAARSPTAVILHGDFHRGNVLASARAGWLAIDPCPLVGDPEYDVADLAADFLDEHIGQAAEDHHLTIVMSSLRREFHDLDFRRVRQWMLTKRVALAMDNIVATGGGEWDLTFARLLVNNGSDPDHD